MLLTSSRSCVPRSHGCLSASSGMSPRLANSRRSKVASGEKCRSSPVSVSTRRAAAPIGAEPRAEAVVRPAGLRLDLVARRAAARPGGVAVEIIEPGQPGRDRHLVDEGDGVGQRELQPAAAAAAEEAAAAAAPAAATEAAASAAAPPASAGRAAAGWRAAERLGAQRWRRRCGPAAGGGVGAPARRPDRRRNWARIWSITDCDGRRDFSGLEKSKPMRSVSARAVEIDRAQVDAHQLARRSRTKRSGKAASIAGVDR